MDPLVTRFLAETLPVVGAAALLWGLIGAVLGGLLGGGLYALLGRRGWWRVPGRADAVVRVLSLVVCVGSGVVAGAGVAGTVGVRVGAEDAIRQNRVGKEVLPAYGKLGGDLVALVTWWAAVYF